MHEYMTKIKNFPEKLEEILKGVSETELDQKAVNWSIRQVVHHIADSHLNSYIRIKLALTEENLTIKPYNETAWAELIDYKQPIADSLQLLRSVHKKITLVLEDINEADFDKIKFNHPEQGELIFSEYVKQFSSHGEGHLVHIEKALKK